MDGRVGSPGEAPEPAGMLEEEELRLGERRKAEERQRDRERREGQRGRRGVRQEDMEASFAKE